MPPGTSVVRRLRLSPLPSPSRSAWPARGEGQAAPVPDVRGGRDTGLRPANAPGAGRTGRPGAAVLAFRKPLAQLAEDRARHPVALQPAKQLRLAGGELDALQVSAHLRGQALSQEIHGSSPPLGRSLASWYRGAVTKPAWTVVGVLSALAMAPTYLRCRSDSSPKGSFVRVGRSRE